jgi:hypothetical protein
MKQQILIEQVNPSDSNIIVETTNTSSGKNLWLSGIFMQGEIVNRNGRKYPLTEISRAVQSASTKITETGGIFGELDHPQSLSINMDRISHVITEMKMVGNNAIGKAKMLNTPMGLIGKTLIEESGVRVGISSRGAGQVTEDIVNGFMFVTADLVATPSAPGALPESIYESLQNNVNGKQVLSLSEQIQHDSTAQKFFEKQILKFLSSMAWQKTK